MARLVGFIANRPDLCNRFAEYEAAALSAKTHDSAADAWGWGVGFFQGGEVLLKRRPLDESRTLTIGDMISDVRSDLLLAQIRRATVGSLRSDNTHPFRYRQWMFADTGTVDGFTEFHNKLHESLPEFLQRSLRGDTDSELLFHLFLSFLHDVGKLDRHVVPPRDVFSALRAALGLLDRLGRDAGLSDSKLNILLAAPDYLIAAQRGAPMAYRVLSGREDFEPLFGEEGPTKLRMPDLEPCRLCVIASDFDGEVPPDWTVVPERSMIAFTRTDEPTILTPRSK